jgi:thiol:disulfide interchange protein DsbD
MYAQILIVCALIGSHVLALTPTVEWITPDKKVSVSFTLPVEKDDELYREYLDFSCDQETINITEWKADGEATPVYDTVCKENKRAYTSDVTFHVTLDLQQPIDEATLRFTYYKKNKGTLEEENIHLSLRSRHEIYERPLLATAADAQQVIVEYTDPTHESPRPVEETVSLSCKISDMITQSDSWIFQCILIFILGTLLSLTPCIYPMIPITVGILQGQGTSSFIRSLAISLCYTTGVATTFALMGVTAAYTGKLFGTFMQHPLVIFAIVAMLLYLAFSMFGFYEMYIPKGLSSNNRFLKGGSPLTAFLFGIASGTVASPCVSPGLALVLSIVAGLANPLLGFIFMFAFGVGLSMPLFIVGTFSGSLNKLPRAGMWMIEIKKIFGFLMLGMCVYFLKMILPPFITAWLWAALSAAAGFYFLKAAKKFASFGKILCNLLGIGFSAGSVLLSYFALLATLHPEDCSVYGLWTEDYVCAHNQALHEHKTLLLKIEAPCCSMCTAIDTKFFKNPVINNVLEESYVPVKIDGSRTDSAVILDIIHKFGIVGFPTLLLIDAKNESLLRKWESDLYNLSVEEFKQILVDYKQANR